MKSSKDCNVRYNETSRFCHSLYLDIWSNFRALVQFSGSLFNFLLCLVSRLSRGYRLSGGIPLPMHAGMFQGPGPGFFHPSIHPHYLSSLCVHLPDQICLCGPVSLLIAGFYHSVFPICFLTRPSACVCIIPSFLGF